MSAETSEMLENETEQSSQVIELKIGSGVWLAEFDFDQYPDDCASGSQFHETVSEVFNICIIDKRHAQSTEFQVKLTLTFHITVQGHCGGIECFEDKFPEVSMTQTKKQKQKQKNQNGLLTDAQWSAMEWYVLRILHQRSEDALIAHRYWNKSFEVSEDPDTL